MHSSLVRVQNVFGFFTTVAFTVAAFVAISVVLAPQSPSATISLRNVQIAKGRPHYNSPKTQDYVSIKFDLDADFSSLFTWNTKQLFIYVLATYPSANSSLPPSQAVIWDQIISSSSQRHPLSPFAFLLPTDSASESQRRPSAKLKAMKGSKSSGFWSRAHELQADRKKDGLVSLKNQRQKYKINDPSGKLAEKEGVQLEVGWNVQPWVGALTWKTPEEGRWLGRWAALNGGKSEVFSFPPIKGTAKDTAK